MIERGLFWGGVLGVALCLCASGCRSAPSEERAAHPEGTGATTAPTAPEHDAVQVEAPMDVVVWLSETIGERNTRNPDALRRSADGLVARFEAIDGLAVRALDYDVDGVTCTNVEATLPATAPGAPILVVGAHYDSAPGTPGADDNATGVAVLLAAARELAAAGPGPWEVRFVAFTNEEPPYFATPDMGSLRYADSLLDEVGNERVRGMISLESLGYFDDAPGSQSYPPLLGALYPDAGTFVGVVGGLDSRAWNAAVTAALRDALDEEGSGVSSIETLSAPLSVTGVDWSDHRSFAAHGVPAVMITDTAVFRNPHYHEPTDEVSTLDADRLAAVTNAVGTALQALTTSPPDE